MFVAASSPDALFIMFECSSHECAVSVDIANVGGIASCLRGCRSRAWWAVASEIDALALLALLQVSLWSQAFFGLA